MRKVKIHRRINGETVEITLRAKEVAKAREVSVKNFFDDELRGNFDIPRKDIEAVSDSAYDILCEGNGETEYECLEKAYDEYRDLREKGEW